MLSRTWDHKISIRYRKLDESLLGQDQMSPDKEKVFNEIYSSTFNYMIQYRVTVYLKLVDLMIVY